MMNQSELLALFGEGKDAWNEWVDANPDAIADFSVVEFDNDVTFKGFRFPNDTNFSGATFSGDADFSEATFSGGADFSEATFSGGAVFSKTTLSGYAKFSEATFSGYAYFSKATFSDYANFSEATFSGSLSVFSGATFSGGAVFSKTTFSGDADFSEAKFSGDADFSEATFSGGVDFSKVALDVAYFRRATFSGDTSFSSIGVEGRVEFDDAEFHSIPDFHAAKNPERIALDTVEFSLPKPSGLILRCVHWLTGLCGSDRSTMIRIRQIRGIANKNHAIDTERDLTILERNAQIGAAWAGLKKLRPFNDWMKKLSTAVFGTPLLLLYRWSSDYGRSVKRPLVLLIASPFLWYVIYLKLYITAKLPSSLPLNSLKLNALQDIAVSGSLPFGTALRPTYMAATQTLFGESGNLPLQFQIASLLQSVTSLILLFLIGLALRNFFRMK